MARFGRPGRPRRETAQSMFRNYDNSVISHTQMARRDRIDKEKKENPSCCCCKATHVLLVCNFITFLISIALLYVGALINNHVSGWDVKGTKIMGHLFLGLGAFVLLVSILGIAAARTRLRTVEFLYLFFLILMAAFLVMVLTHIAIEAENLDGFLERNWDEITKVLGTDTTIDEARSAFEDYFIVILVFLSLGVVMMVLTLICAMRLLGLRFIAMAQLVALGVVGAGTMVCAFFTRGHIPTITTWLIFACGAVQILCSLCGLAGFAKKNRECICWLFTILALSTVGLVYVAAASYKQIQRKTGNDEDIPEDLLLIFAIATMCAVFNGSTLVFEGLYYCRLRRAFKEADKAAQLPVHFSNNHRRHLPGKKRGKRGGFEYNPRSAL